MKKLIAACAGLAAMAAGAAWAQEDPARLHDQLSGRELRLPDNDRVIGGVRAVIDQDGELAAVIDLEEQERTVAVPLADIEQQGGKLYLDLEEQELSALPDHAVEEGEAPSAGLPHGGLTPGWGGATPQAPGR